MISSLCMYMKNEMNWCCRYDCGMFAIKYMEYWNRATLTHSLAKVSTTYPLCHSLFGIFSIPPYAYLFIIQDKMHLYSLRLIVNLVMNEAFL